MFRLVFASIISFKHDPLFHQKSNFALVACYSIYKLFSEIKKKYYLSEANPGPDELYHRNCTGKSHYTL